MGQKIGTVLLWVLKWSYNQVQPIFKTHLTLCVYIIFFKKQTLFRRANNTLWTLLAYGPSKFISSEACKYNDSLTDTKENATKQHIFTLKTYERAGITLFTTIKIGKLVVTVASCRQWRTRNWKLKVEVINWRRAYPRCI